MSATGDSGSARQITRQSLFVSSIIERASTRIISSGSTFGPFTASTEITWSLTITASTMKPTALKLWLMELNGRERMLVTLAAILIAELAWLLIFLAVVLYALLK